VARSSPCFACLPAEDVATADDDGELDAEILNFLDFLRNRIAGLGGNAVLAFALKRLAAQLQHHAPVFGLRSGWRGHG